MWHSWQRRRRNPVGRATPCCGDPRHPGAGSGGLVRFLSAAQVAKRALSQPHFSSQHAWHPSPKIPKSQHRPFRCQPGACGPSQPGPAGAPRRQPKPQHQLGPTPGQPRAAFRRVATAAPGTQAPFRAVPEWPAKSRWPARAPGRPRRPAKNPQKPKKIGRRHRRAEAPCSTLLPILHPVFSRDTEGH